ncbi:hypothetical protein N431DRAFT_348602 [Stipitochalara longipes BDJ]|nr:hypothetical protein N431DRAFT_348602 [Stipitochalara longipes BDJ]
MPSTSTPDSESSASKRLRAALDECLSSIQSNGSFALFEHLPNPILPGITLKKGGPIGLPLTERDAQVIIAASHAAPFGKGEATIIDENIRKTWELSASSFEIRNPAWENFLQSIVAKVSEGLGIDLAGTGVRAELYKMLLYDKGAMFKPHQDSEKAPGMFATLVIALPSKHEGGQVRVNHGGLTKVFETSKFSEFDSSYLAWFANVTHEIRPVLAGYRLVLTYNLIQSNIGPHKPTASSINVMTKLRSTLFNWKQNLQNKDVPEILAYLLQHQYTNASLGYDGLKGQDKEVAAYLQEACRVSGFCLYLANLDRTVSGGTDDFGDLSSDYEYENTGRFHSGGGRFHDIFDESSRQTILKNVVELDGTDIDKDLNFDEERFVQTDPFGNEHPDDEDYAGTYGNGGPCATHFYHRTVFCSLLARLLYLANAPQVALIIPRTYLVKFFLDASKEIASYSRNSVVNTEAPRIKQWLDRLSAQLALASVDSVHRCDMKEFCEFVISHCSTWESREVANSTLQCIGGLLIGYKLEALLPV